MVLKTLWRRKTPCRNVVKTTDYEMLFWQSETPRRHLVNPGDASICVSNVLAAQTRCRRVVDTCRGSSSHGSGSTLATPNNMRTPCGHVSRIQLSWSMRDSGNPPNSMWTHHKHMPWIEPTWLGKYFGNSKHHADATLMRFLAITATP